MLGVCHFIFGKFFNVKVFTVTVNVTVTLVRAIFQEMRNLRIFFFFMKMGEKKYRVFFLIVFGLPMLRMIFNQFK